jgi:uncharacterized protein (DUF433 family)
LIHKEREGGASAINFTALEGKASVRLNPSEEGFYRAPSRISLNIMWTGFVIMENRLLKRIIVDPRIMVGKPVIRGTRIPVDAIIHRIALGDTIEELLEDYPKITRLDVKAALEYAESLVRGEDVLPRIKS